MNPNAQLLFEHPDSTHHIISCKPYHPDPEYKDYVISHCGQLLKKADNYSRQFKDVVGARFYLCVPCAREYYTHHEQARMDEKE